MASETEAEASTESFNGKQQQDSVGHATQYIEMALNMLRKTVFSADCLFTLLVRNPEIKDADFVFSTDDLEKAVASLSVFADKKSSIIEPA